MGELRHQVLRARLLSLRRVALLPALAVATAFCAAAAPAAGPPVSGAVSTLLVERLDGMGSLDAVQPGSGAAWTVVADPPAPFAALSIDGERVAFEAKGRRLAVSDLEGDEEKVLTRHGVGEVAYGRSAIGYTFTPSEGGMRVETISDEGGPARVAFTGSGLETVVEPSIDAAGSTVAFAIGNTARGPFAPGVYVAGTDGTNARLLVPAREYAGEPELSPDGTRVVYVSCGRAGRSPTGCDLFVAPVDGSESTRLTHSPALPEGHPQFSPDGLSIAFEDVGRDIVSIGVDGSGGKTLMKGPVGLVDWGLAAPQPRVGKTVIVSAVGRATVRERGDPGRPLRGAEIVGFGSLLRIGRGAAVEVTVSGGTGERLEVARLSGGCRFLLALGETGGAPVALETRGRGALRVAAGNSFAVRSRAGVARAVGRAAWLTVEQANGTYLEVVRGSVELLAPSGHLLARLRRGQHRLVKDP